MLQHSFSRTELLIGTDGLEKLRNSKLLFALAVGSFVVEALVKIRSWNNNFNWWRYSLFNYLNEQVHATYKTIGKDKVEVMKERIHSINENVMLTHQIFVTPENLKELIQKMLIMW